MNNPAEYAVQNKCWCVDYANVLCPYFWAFRRRVGEYVSHQISVEIMLFIMCQEWHFILKAEAMLFIILTLRFLKAPLDYDVLIHSSADCKSLFLFQMLWVQRISFSLVLWKRWKALLQERLLGQIRRAVPRLQRSNRHRPHYGKRMQRLSCFIPVVCCYNTWCRMTHPKYTTETYCLLFGNILQNVWNLDQPIIYNNNFVDTVSL